MGTKELLSEKAIQTIQATVPLLQERGVEITKRFYEMMFTKHPELLNIFNHANQKKGRQPEALANVVYAAAVHIDKLETILPAVKQIAHKHRSLGVKAEHYPIVGQHLLQAIEEVVGAPQEVLDAWAEAYGVIADVFIQVEAEMYKQAEGKTGGWKDFRSFTVVKKVKESEVITSFYLQPTDGGALAAFEPGQYVSVKLEIPEQEYTHIRQYSLSDAPSKEYYRISVKREESNDIAGVVSNYLHNEVKEGDVLPLSAPAGDFVLQTHTSLPVVLLSGGVGFTPLMSMLNTIIEKYPDRSVTFIHGAQNGRMHAMKEYVAQAANQHSNVTAYTVYSAPTEEDRQQQSFQKEGFIDLEWLQSVLPSNEAEFYFCGPVPFMKQMNAVLKEWNVAPERIHFEFFGPAASLE